MIRVAARVRQQDVLGRLNRLKDRLRNGPEKDTMFKQWSARYLTYLRRRFDRNSKGGGDWAPLSQRTIAGRRYKGGKTIGGARRGALARLRRARSAKTATKDVRRLKRIAAAAASVAILRDTGTLFRAFLAGQPGNVVRRSGDNALEVGIGGASPDAGRKGKKPVTIGQLAVWHHYGVPANNLPARPLVVPPDEDTRAAMKEDARRAVEASIRNSK